MQILKYLTKRISAEACHAFLKSIYCFKLLNTMQTLNKTRSFPTKENVYSMKLA